MWALCWTAGEARYPGAPNSCQCFVCLTPLCRHAGKHMILRVRKRPGMEGEDVLKGAGEAQVGSPLHAGGLQGRVGGRLHNARRGMEGSCWGGWEGLASGGVVPSWLVQVSFNANAHVPVVWVSCRNGCEACVVHGAWSVRRSVTGCGVASLSHLSCAFIVAESDECPHMPTIQDLAEEITDDEDDAYAVDPAALEVGDEVACGAGAAFWASLRTVRWCTENMGYW